MKETVGIGIIGTGFARRVQIPAFLQCAGARIASVASGHLENAKATANEFGVEHFTDDWRETIARADVDLVCITTPPDTHFEMTLEALEHGKHVLCEKPMAMNAEQAGAMTKKAKEKNVLALIDHELRFQAGRQKAFEMLREGFVGKIRRAKYTFRAPHRGDANLPWNWWSDVDAGGGALGAIGSHCIDSLLWLAGADVSEIFCQLQTHVKERRDAKTNEPRAVTSDDEATMILRFADSDLTEDATAVVSVSMVEFPDYQNSLEFSGTRGAIRIEYKGEVFAARAGEENWRQIENISLGAAIEGVGDTGFSRGFTAFAPRIVEAIQNGATEIEHAATFEDGLKVQEILDAARASNASGCTVKL